MDQITNRADFEKLRERPSRRPRKMVLAIGALVVAAGLGGEAYRFIQKPAQPPKAAIVSHVTASKPLLRNLDSRLGFLGQFSAVDKVEVRSQVGGTLSELHFTDGQIVRKGDLLFVIDPRPFEIKLAQAKAQLKIAEARVGLTSNQLARAQSLRRNEFATQETVDQRTSDQDSSSAAVDDAKARLRDAELDLEYSRVRAPFTGRIGARQVSLGGLVAGSRAATSPTTLLATIVSLDPLHLDFEMSESDFLRFSRDRSRAHAGAEKVSLGLSDENVFSREGTLDFVDNALDRSSGTMHARATVPNPDLLLAPGQFAKLKLSVSPPAPVLLVPDAAVMPDQSQHRVMTVDRDNVVVPKIVEVGEIRGGLRVIRKGLAPSDSVVVKGSANAVAGAKVAPEEMSLTYDQKLDDQF